MDLLISLIDRGAIRIADVPSENAVDFKYGDDNEPSGIERWYPFRVTYKINIRGIETPADEVNLSYLPDGILTESEANSEIAVALWKEIAEEECTSYLEERCYKLRLAFELTEKGRSHVAKALEWFSVAQVRKLIWMSTKDVLSFIREHGAHPAQQKHLPAKFLLNKAERAKANGWEMKPYNQPQNRCALVEVVAHQLLGIGDKWEMEIVSKSNLILGNNNSKY